MMVVEGRLVSKRKRAEWIVLTLEHETKRSDEDDDDNSYNETTTTTVYVPRTTTTTTTTTTRPLCGSTQCPSLVSSDLPSSSPGTIPSFVFYLHGVLRVCGEYTTSLERNKDTAGPLDCVLVKEIAVDESTSCSDQWNSRSTYPMTAGDAQCFLVANKIQLVQCAPDPQAVSAVIRAVVSDMVHVTTLWPWNHGTSLNATAVLLHSQKRHLCSLLEHCNDGSGKASSMSSSLAHTAAMIVHTLSNAHHHHHPVTMNDSVQQQQQQQQQQHGECVVVWKRRAPKGRVRKVKASDLAVLERVETHWASSTPSRSLLLQPYLQSFAAHTAVSETWLNQQPLALPCTMSSRGHQTRHDYLVTKKWPQIDWMVQRIAQMVQHHRDGRQFGHILDIGGGRGDLALALLACQAAQAATTNGAGVDSSESPLRNAKTIISMVDRNASSVAAGRAAADAWNQRSDAATVADTRLHFIAADIADYAADPQRYYNPDHPPPVDLVVALHACGNLSDVALDYATQRQCSFLICPCCYTKRFLVLPPRSTAATVHGELFSKSESETKFVEDASDPETIPVDTMAVLSRLAELNEHASVRHRAALIINATRLERCQSSASVPHDQSGSILPPQGVGCVAPVSGRYSTLQQEEFCSSYSTRNLVLVGIAQHTEL
jgi:Methyltransferase domain